MTKKFTQQELQEAYQQMREERENDYHKALGAARELEQIVGRSCRVSPDFHEIRPAPKSIDYVLVLTEETYGPFLETFTSVLDNLPNAQKLAEDKRVRGYDRDYPQYLVKTSVGEYVIAFEYFNNHSCGW